MAEKIAAYRSDVALGFADMDQDGDIDIVTGRWAPRGSTEAWRSLPKTLITNHIWWNDGGRAFRREAIPGVVGQTLTLLIDDFDDDGVLDIFTGNDAGWTNMVTFMDAGGRFRKTGVEEQPFPYYTLSSMSVDQGDWNNDLRTDYYEAQTATGRSSDADISTNENRGSSIRSQQTRALYEICTRLALDEGWSKEQTGACRSDMLSGDTIRDGLSGTTLDSCERPRKPRDRALCGAYNMLRRGDHKRRNVNGDTAAYDRCRALLANMALIQRYCGSLLVPTHGPDYQLRLKPLYRPGSGNGNILATNVGEALFSDKAQDTGSRFPGWSWNSRFTDLDQDGRQDILVMTGIWLEAAGATTNVFYRNTGDGFERAEQDYGFFDVLPSYAYVTADYDRDGDVDVMRGLSPYQMIVHRNDAPLGTALRVHLKQPGGNSRAIGARIVICVDGESEAQPGKCQMRNVRASGGFMSSEPIVAHFGLGAAKSVSLIQVTWPDGKISRIAPAGLDQGEIVISRMR